MRHLRIYFKDVKHVPGKKMFIADALSRLHVRKLAKPQPTIGKQEMTPYIGSVLSMLPVSETRLQQIMEAQDEDPVCRQTKEYCSEGWPNKHSLNGIIRPYWAYRGEITVVQNILLKACRIVIPYSVRLEILDKIHEGH